MQILFTLRHPKAISSYLFPTLLNVFYVASLKFPKTLIDGLWHSDEDNYCLLCLGYSYPVQYSSSSTETSSSAAPR